jgi:uncharacterized protein YbjT (DUF2867 family)
MTILVTGATGNVGGHLVRALIGRCVPVRAFVRDAGAAARKLGPNVDLAVGDFADRRSAGAARISFVDPRDVAEVAAEALTDARHEGRTYTLTGPEAITFERVAGEIAAALRRPVAYVNVGDDNARQAMVADGLPPMVADAIVAIFASQRAGSMADTTNTVWMLTGHEPRGITAFAREVFAPAVAGAAVATAAR